MSNFTIPHGFESPNYTQAPNEFFEIMPDMCNAELRVFLAILRETSGYHRDSTALSTSQISAMTGLSGNAVIKGARAAEARGIIKRLNPGSKKSAKWQIRWAKTSSKNEDDKSQHPQKARKTSSENEPQLGLKENKNNKDSLKESKKGEGFETWQDTPKEYHPYFEACINLPTALPEPKTPKQISQWLTTFKEWSEAGYSVKQVMAAGRLHRERGLNLVAPKSINWAIEAIISKSNYQRAAQGAIAEQEREELPGEKARRLKEQLKQKQRA